MFARVIMGGGKPERAEAGIRNFRESIEPAARKMAGFKGPTSSLIARAAKYWG